MDKGKQPSRGGERGEHSGRSRAAPGGGIGEELKNMLASQGKGTSNTTASTAAATEAMHDLRLDDTPPSAGARFRQANGRARTPTNIDAEYAAFQAQPQYTDKVQLSGANTEFMEQAWRSSIGPAQPAPAPATTEAQAPRPVHANDLQGDAQKFLAELDAIGEEVDAVHTPAPPAMPVAHLTESWRPPSPSQGRSMSREQYEMHERLAKRQTGVLPDQPYRQAEAVAPPPDDAALNEGVYAPNPEQALASVWDAQQARAAHVQQYRANEKTKPVSGASYTKIRGQEVVDKLRGWLVREGYTEVGREADAGRVRASSAGHAHIWRGNERCARRTGRGAACKGHPALGRLVPPPRGARHPCRKCTGCHGTLAGAK